jgi:hypothetical protein
MTKTNATPATPDGLSPCPFCGCMLRHVETWARSFEPPRLYHGYQHENNGCILSSKGWYFDDKPDSRMAFITKWNARVSTPLADNGLASELELV